MEMNNFLLETTDKQLNYMKKPFYVNLMIPCCISTKLYVYKKLKIII